MTKEEAKEWLDTIIARYEVEDEWVTLCDRRHYIAIKMAIKALEQEPCADAISRQAAIDRLSHWYSDMLETNKEQEDLIEVIKAIPSAEPKTGHWIKTISENGITSAVRCSECGFEDNRYMLFKYCPNCGAKMVTPQESEEKE